MKKRSSTNNKKAEEVVDADDDDDEEEDDDDGSDCLACMGRHRPHTCTRESRKTKKAARKLQAESSVSEPSPKSREKAKKGETSSKKPKVSQAVEADANPRRRRQQESQQASEQAPEQALQQASEQASEQASQQALEQASQRFATRTSARETSLREIIVSASGEALLPSTTGGSIVDRPSAVIPVHPALTTEAVEAAIAAVPPASGPATAADSTNSQRLMNCYWDDLMTLPMESSPESDK
mmetsp:Transcript_48730/g.83215  ORF Transcript_48730/g.83215 Transcript_48730/m.83215 type:complete len:240 (+) Transcript_48730:240-959(+)